MKESAAQFSKMREAIFMLLFFIAAAASQNNELVSANKMNLPSSNIVIPNQIIPKSGKN